MARGVFKTSAVYNFSSFYNYYVVCLLLFLTILCPTNVFSSSKTALVVEQDLAVGNALNLQCPPCDMIHCIPRHPKKMKCKGGITTGICDCCPVCAKVEGESCGGLYDYRGRCDKGLICEADVNAANTYDDLFGASQVDEGLKVSITLEKNAKDSKEFQKTTHHKSEGKCKQVPPDKSNDFSHSLMDQAIKLNHCKPRCTPEFCRDHPRAICSAADNADFRRDCQGDCQHTACKACRFVLMKARECTTKIKCGGDDFECLKKFGQCTKDSVCPRKYFPCGTALVKEVGARFECVVPECLTS